MEQQHKALHISDIISHILLFAEPQNYITYGLVNKLIRKIYLQRHTRTTHIRNVVTSLPVTIWARDNGCPPTPYLCAYASVSGNRLILWWLRTQDMPLDDQTISWAAENGHFNILKWIRRRVPLCLPPPSAEHRESVERGHVL